MKSTILISTLALLVAGAAPAQVSVGPFDNTIGGGGNYTFFGDGLIFDVIQPTTIISVDVYPFGAGNVVVNLQDSTLAVIMTATVAVPASSAGVKTTIPVGFNNIPAGTGYRLDATGTTTGGLYRNSSGAVYPYSAPGQLNITGPINALVGFYYFFYNWSIAPPTPAPWPGTQGGDLTLATGVNGTPSSFPYVKSATALDYIILEVRSPMGTYDYQPFVLLAQPFTTGFPPNPTIPALGVWLDLTQPYVILVNIDPFLTQYINPTGTTYAFAMPPGFVGQSFLFQAAAVTPATSLTDAFEIQVM
jgi:hypothetical protein